MYNALKIQVIILKKQVLTHWVFWISLSFSFLLGFFILHFSSTPDSLSFLSLMKGEKNGFNFAASLVFSAYRIILFFLVVMASISIAGEVQSGLLKSLLVKKIKRNHLLLGKSSSLAIFFFLLFAIIFLLSLATGGLLYGFSDIAEKGYIIHTTPSLLLNCLLTLFLMLFPICALTIFSLFFSVLFNNPILPIICSLGVNFIFSILVELDLMKNLFLTNYLFFPLIRLKRMAQGLPAAPNSEVIIMIMATLLYSGVFLTLSMLIFRKKELT